MHVQKRVKKSEAKEKNCGKKERETELDRERERGREGDFTICVNKLVLWLIAIMHQGGLPPSNRVTSACRTSLLFTLMVVSIKTNVRLGREAITGKNKVNCGKCVGELLVENFFIHCGITISNIVCSKIISFRHSLSHYFFMLQS